MVLFAKNMLIACFVLFAKKERKYFTLSIPLNFCVSFFFTWTTTFHFQRKTKTFLPVFWFFFFFIYSFLILSIITHFLHSHFCIDYQVLFSIEAFHSCWKLSIIELQMSLNDFRILHSLQYLINVKFSKIKY